MKKHSNNTSLTAASAAKLQEPPGSLAEVLPDILQEVAAPHPIPEKAEERYNTLEKEANIKRENNRRHIVIIGGGFGGIAAAKELKGAGVEVTLIDKSNHHLFQPLLYQVATAALSPGDIAVPIRSILGSKSGVNVLLGEVTDIKLKEKYLCLFDGRTIFFDQLVLATGARYNYFGNKGWEQFAPGLKSVSDALKVREKILFSLEEAEQTKDAALRKPLLTYVIIGGGPTGIEMAGAIAEITKKEVLRDYRNIRPEDTRICLVEAGSGLLNGYPERLAKKAVEMLEELGVEVLLNTPVTHIERDCVRFKEGSIGSANIIWAAGVMASPLVKMLGTEHDRLGRVMVKPDLSIPGHPDIFVIGDAAHLKDRNGHPLPAVASVATQQGNFVGKLLRKDKASRKAQAEHFRYHDKGSMATIGRARAVAKLKGMQFSGLTAWLLWSVVHILFLIGFRNRFHVFVEWLWYYFTFKRGVRLITDRPDCHHCNKNEDPARARPPQTGSFPLNTDKLPLN